MDLYYQCLRAGYSISKHEAEMEVWRASQEGVPVVIVNPGVIIGPGFWKSGSGLFFYAAARESKYYLPNGTGFVSVNDVVNAMLQLMDSDIKNERFILVNENWSYFYLSKLLASGLHKKAPSKELKGWMLNFFWRLDWLKSAITGSRRKLSKNTAKILQKTEVYDNSKIQKFLPQFQHDDLEATTLLYYFSKRTGGLVFSDAFLILSRTRSAFLRDLSFFCLRSSSMALTSLSNLDSMVLYIASYSKGREA